MGGTDRTGLRRRSSESVAGPVRTCVGCRQPDSWSALLRIVAGTSDQGHPILLPDPARRMPGRGCWLHPRSECLAKALRKRAFPRALRYGGPLSESLVTAYVNDAEQSNAQPPPTRPKAGFRDEHPMSTQK
ncbi:YlxR family protein [Nostocoides vanveenii]|uniref:YlxR family protein n=1 Tax=Nostocoides vanveenii TaxID=330835 RepID=UPI0031E19E1F